MPQGVKYATEEERIQARREASRRWREKQDRSEYYRQYELTRSQEQKDRKAAKRKEAEKQDPERFRQYRRKNYEKNKSNWAVSVEMIMFKNAKKRAKDKNVSFSLDLTDIVIPETCPILGIPLIKEGGKSVDSSPSLDRVISSLGYTKDNVRVISHLANTIKSSGTAEQHRKIADYIDAHVSSFPSA